MAKIPTHSTAIFRGFRRIFRQPQKNGLILISIHIYIELEIAIPDLLMDSVTYVTTCYCQRNQHKTTNFKNGLTILQKNVHYLIYHSSSWIFTGHLFHSCPRNFHGFRALAFESPANAWLTFSSARRVQRSQALNGARHVSMPKGM